MRGGQGNGGRKWNKVESPQIPSSDIIPLPKGPITSPTSITNWEPGVEILWETFLIYTTTRLLKRKSGHVFKEKGEATGF